jgi:hypothetical protein
MEVDELTPAMGETNISTHQDTNYQGDFLEIECWSVQKRWDKAALKYLDLICLQQNAFQTLGRKAGTPGPFDISMKSFLQEADFQFLRAWRTIGDTKSMSMTEVLRETKYDGDEVLNEAQIQDLKEWVKHNAMREDGVSAVAAKSWEDTYNFGANFHCETILLWLHLLARDQEKIVEQNPKRPHPAFLQLPPQSLLDKFSATLKYLPTSKCCCPACHALVKYYKRVASVDLVYEGCYENWVSVTLPPWIPKDAGQAVIKEAEKKLRYRLRQFVNRDSTSEQPLSSGSSPVKKLVPDTLQGLTLGGIKVIPSLSGPPEDSEEEDGPRGTKNKRVASEHSPIKNFERR